MMKRYVYKFSTDERDMIYKLFNTAGLAPQIYKRSGQRTLPQILDTDDRLINVSLQVTDSKVGDELSNSISLITVDAHSLSHLSLSQIIPF